jgi:hypothetical protein
MSAPIYEDYRVYSVLPHIERFMVQLRINLFETDPVLQHHMSELAANIYRGAFEYMARRFTLTVDPNASYCETKVRSVYSGRDHEQYNALICLGVLKNSKHVHAEIIFGHSRKRVGMLYYCSLESLFLL